MVARFIVVCGTLASSEFGDAVNSSAYSEWHFYMVSPYENAVKVFLTVSSVIPTRSRTPAPDDSIKYPFKTKKNHRRILRLVLLDVTYRSHAIHERTNLKGFVAQYEYHKVSRSIHQLAVGSIAS